VLRTAFSPRWLGGLVVVMVLAAGMVWLGFWQWRVAEEDGRADALRTATERPVLVLTDYLTPHAAFPSDGSNQRLSAVGHYEPAQRVLVVDRRLDGVAGRWVVEPFVVDATGARIPVVRGFVPETAAGTAYPLVGMPATATLTLVGSLAPTESPQAARAPLGAHEVTSVTTGSLLNEWGGEIYNAFLFAVSETPADAAAAVPQLRLVPPPEIPSGLTLRNAAYALQWWVFAVFVVWMWARMVRDDYRRDQQSASDQSSDESSDPQQPAGAPQ